jgi:flagellar hook-associated protein 1 FlgK
MGGIVTSLFTAGNALNVYQDVFSNIQSNIANVNTPGYAQQDQSVLSSAGPGGGVQLGPLLSSRSQYLDQAVRTQQGQVGAASQQTQDLAQVQTLFDVTGKSGPALALNNFFNSFSQLSVTPNDPTQRQNVLNAANNVAQAFVQNAKGLAAVSAGVDSQTRTQVSTVNQLAQQIADLNHQLRETPQSAGNPGIDAQANAALENLSQVVNFSTVKQPDGTYSVYIGGQTPLVIGADTYALSPGFSSTQATIQSQGKDITAELQNTGGSLGALLQERNQTLPGYSSSLNTAAQNFADTVNTQLAQGLDQTGNAPTTNLFGYNATLGAAGTLQVNNLTTSQLAAASAGAPGGSGNALAVAAIATQPLASGLTVTQAYAGVAAQVGSDAASSQQHQTSSQSLLVQAQQQRSQVSGVSLNEEAAKLVQFQQAYQAVGQYVSILKTLNTTLLNMLQ